MNHGALKYLEYRKNRLDLLVQKTKVNARCTYIIILLYRGCLAKRGGRSYYLTSIYCKKCSKRQKVNEKEAGDGRYYLPNVYVPAIPLGRYPSHLKGNCFKMSSVAGKE